MQKINNSKKGLFWYDDATEIKAEAYNTIQNSKETLTQCERVLQAFKNYPNGTTLEQISEDLNLPKSTISARKKDLIKKGYYIEPLIETKNGVETKKRVYYIYGNRKVPSTIFKIFN